MTHLMPMEVHSRSSALLQHHSFVVALQAFWSVSTLDATSNNYLHNSHSSDNVNNNFVLGWSWWSLAQTELNSHFISPTLVLDVLSSHVDFSSHVVLHHLVLAYSLSPWSSFCIPFAMHRTATQWLWLMQNVHGIVLFISSMTLACSSLKIGEGDLYLLTILTLFHDSFFTSLWAWASCFPLWVWIHAGLSSGYQSQQWSTSCLNF